MIVIDQVEETHKETDEVYLSEHGIDYPLVSTRGARSEAELLGKSLLTELLSAHGILSRMRRNARNGGGNSLAILDHMMLYHKADSI